MRNDEKFQKDITVYIYAVDEVFLGTGFLLNVLEKTYIITCAHVLAQGIETSQGSPQCLRPITHLLIKAENNEILKVKEKYICPFEEYVVDKIKGGTQPDIIAIELIDFRIIPAYEIWDGNYTQGAELFFRGKPDKSSIPINFYNNTTFDNSIDSTIFVIEIGQYLQLNYNEDSAKKNTALSEIRGVSGSGIFCYQGGRYFCLGVFKGLFDNDAIYYKGKAVSICKLTQMLQLKEIRIDAIVEPKFKPTLKWAQDIVSVAIKEAGKRFITFNNCEYTDLNFETSSSNILDHITNTEFSKIQEFLKEFNEDLECQIRKALINVKEIHGIYKRYDSMVCPGGLTWDEIKNENLIKEKTIWFNETHFKNLREILAFRDKTTELTKYTHNLSAQLFFDHQFHRLLTSFDFPYRSAMFFLSENRKYKEKAPSEFLLIIPLCEVIIEIYSLMLMPIIDFYVSKKFDSTFNSDNLLTTAFFKHLFIKGEGLSGKTHLLCDYALRNTQSGNCTLLFFGNSFFDSRTPIKQMIDLLDLTSLNLSEDEFLYSLDWWGKKENRLVSICIDAINETKEIQVWKNNFITFVEKIKKYHNINLVISARDLEIDKMLTDDAKEYIRTDMALVEHRGFENISPNVLFKFCEVFGIDVPRFPTLDSIFINPGLMFLLFENLRSRQIKEIDDNILHISNIFNDFVKNLENRFVNTISNSDNDDVYVIPTTNIASKMIIDNNFNEQIVYKEFKNKAQNIHGQILEYLKNEGVFSIKKENAASYAYFSYQRFGNYFIALYLLSKFSSFEDIGNSPIIKCLFRNAEKHESLLESLFRLTLEKYKQPLFDLAPLQPSISEHLKEVEAKAFYSSNCYPQSFSYKLAQIHELSEADRFELFEMLLRVSYKTHHSNRFDKSLHPVLKQFTMADLDCYWSPFISESFNCDIYFEYFQANNVSALIEWVFKQKNFDTLESEHRSLYSLTISWFLASSNRMLRDLATKALVWLLMNNIKDVVELIKFHSDSKDLYIYERVWAVAYGVTLQSSNLNGLCELCTFTCCNIFSKDYVIPHVLIRDYARGIIEYGIYKKVVINISEKKIYPPYKSIWPAIPNDDEIEKFKIPFDSDIPYCDSQNKIIQSIQVEYTRDGSVNTYGDFGRYVFQSKVNYFDYYEESGKQITPNDLMNIAIKRIFDLGYDVKKHGVFDTNIPYDHRMAKSIERVGKKYQWIVLHELLALLSDKFLLKRDWDGRKKKYEGAWQIAVRDIDPTVLLHKNRSDNDFNNTKTTWWQRHDIVYKEITDEAKKVWLWTHEDLPSFKDLLTVREKKNFASEYFILQNFLSWSESSDLEYRRDIWYRIQTVLIKKIDVIKLQERIYLTDRRGYDELNQRLEHSFFLAEYPWHPMFKNTKQKNLDEITRSEFEVIIPCIEFYQLGENLDYSIDKKIHCYLPSPWLMKKMKLKLSQKNGIEYYNKNGDLIFFDPSISEGGPSTTLINKEYLLKLLEKEEMTIAWIIGGEKNLYNKNDMKKWPGRQVLGGFYYWDGKCVSGVDWVQKDGL